MVIRCLFQRDFQSWLSDLHKPVWLPAIAFIIKFLTGIFPIRIFCINLPRFNKAWGTIAQLVEHRTENPGVASSILAGTTS